MKSPFCLCLAALIVWLLPTHLPAENRPRPAEASAKGSSPRILRLDWVDTSRERPVPVLIYLPPAPNLKEPCPVILFSHGLGGSREGYSYLGEHWSNAGYVSVHVQHLGSDDAVWRQVLPEERMTAARRAAATPANALARPRDLSFVIDELTRQNQQKSSPLYHKLDLTRIGAAGHSFGGFTVMAIAGQSFLGGRSQLADPRVKAVVQMSAPVIGGDRVPAAHFNGIRVPVLHMTGTLDDSPVGDTVAEDRRIPYDRTHNATASLVIFQGGDHMIFSGRMQKNPQREASDRVYQKLIREGTTAFWNAHLRDDAGSKKWFYDGGYTQALGPHGTFEHKAPSS